MNVITSWKYTCSMSSNEMNFNKFAKLYAQKINFPKARSKKLINWTMYLTYFKSISVCRIYKPTMGSKNRHCWWYIFNFISYYKVQNRIEALTNTKEANHANISISSGNVQAHVPINLNSKASITLCSKRPVCERSN